MDRITINIGGELIEFQKSPDHFAVKKRIGGVPGELTLAHENRAVFKNLSFRKSQSSKDLEVYTLAADSLEHAMKTLRANGTDVEWCSHVYHTPDNDQGIMIPTDTLYVEFKSNADENDVNLLLDNYGLEISSDYRDVPNTFLLKLISASRLNPLKMTN